MHVKRCDRCELIVGEGCACELPGAGAPRHAVDAMGPIRWAKFAPDTILISSRKMAHLPGACDHMTEADVAIPSWGWIRNPEPGVWDRISAGNPVQATGGNLQRVATTRCSSCLGSLR